VLILNLARCISYPGRGFRGFPQSLQANASILPPLGQYCILGENQKCLTTFSERSHLPMKKIKGKKKEERKVRPVV
jgi:hypothetical protein